MSDAPLTLSLAGLTPLEAAELAAALAKAGCAPESGLRTTPEHGAVGGARKGEPFTMLAVVAVSQMALTGVAIYLAKKRSSSRRWAKLTRSSPNGEVLTFEVEIESHDEEAIKAELIEKIGALKIPLPDAGTGAG